MFSNSMAKLLVNASRIKYDVLDELFEKEDIEIKSNMVNLFIDVHRLYYRLLVNKNTAVVYANGLDELVMDIVLSTLNTIGHYRRYLATRLHKSNRIFLIVNRRAPRFQSRLIYEYGKERFDQYTTEDPTFGPINKAINKALEYIESIIPYFEDVFMINSNRIEECVTMSYIMSCKEAQGDFNILYTNSEFAMQLLNNNCIMLYPHQDKSKIYTHHNWTDYAARQMKKNLNIKDIDVSYAPIFMAIHGLENRGVSSRYIRGPKNILTAIQQVSNSGLCGTGLSIETFLDAIQTLPERKERKPSVSEFETLKTLYKAFHIPTCIAAMTAAEKTRIITGIYNLYDQVQLEKINEALAQFEDIINLTDLNMNRIDTWRSLWED